MDAPTQLAGTTWRSRVVAAASYRYHVLAIAGVLGTAVTLLSGLDALVSLGLWARVIAAYWHTLTHAIWTWLIGWIGINIPVSLLALLNFAFFGMVLAFGVRIRDRFRGRTKPALLERVSMLRAFLGFLGTLLLCFVALLVFAMIQGSKPLGTFEAVVFLVFCLVAMALGFLWTHKFTKHAVQLFPLSLIYAGCLFLIPFTKTMDATSKLDMLLVFASLGLINLIVSLMLAIAPAAALRNRLLASVALSLAFALPVMAPLGVAQVLAMRADTFLTQGQHDDALLRYRQALDIYETLSVMDPDNLDRRTDVGLFMSKIGDVRVASGKGEGALADYKSAIGVGEELVNRAPDNTLHQRNLGVYYRLAGDAHAARQDRSEALASYFKAVEVGEKLANSDPANKLWQTDLAYYFGKVADTLLADGKAGEAIAFYEQVLTIGEKLAEGEPANSDRQTEVGAYASRLGDSLVGAGRNDEAFAQYQKAFAIGERLLQSDPANKIHQRNLGIYHRQLGDVRAGRGEREEAAASYRSAVDIGENLAATDPTNKDWQADLDFYYNKLGDLLLADGKSAEAIGYYEKSLPIREKQAAGDDNRMTDVGVYASRLGDLVANAGRGADALVHYRKAVAIGESLVARAPPGDTLHRRNLGIYHRQVADTLSVQADQRGEVLDNYRKATGLGEAVAGIDPANAMWQGELATYHARSGNLLLADGKAAEAIASYEKCLVIYQKLASTDPDNAERENDMASVHRALAAALAAGNRQDEALSHFKAALAVSERRATEAEITDKASGGAPGPLTAQALMGLGWDLLFVRDFEKALAATQRAHALDPGSLANETNRAHALLFVGRLDEARALYLSHKGKPMSATTRWEDIIANDFAELRRAGIEHRLFGEILAALRD